MLSAGLPQFAPDAVKRLLKERYGLEGELRGLDSYCDQNFLLRQDNGDKKIVKIANPAQHVKELEMQNAAMMHLAGRDIAVPTVLENMGGEYITDINGPDERPYYLRVLSYLPGSFYVEAASETHSEPLWSSLGRFMARMDAALMDFQHVGAYRFLDWDLAHGYAICQSKKDKLEGEKQALVDHFLAYYASHVMPLTPELPKAVIHNDANDYNVLVDDAHKPQSVIGLIDFGDMVYSHMANELAIASAYAMLGQPDPLLTLRTIVAAYHAIRPLGGVEIEALYGLVALRMCTTLCNAAAELSAQPDNEYLLVSVQPAEALLRKLRKIPPFAVECQLRAACGLPLDTGRTKEEIISYRRKHLGKTLSLSFKEPLKIVRGYGAYLYDEEGRDYLDMVNNVCHVGHCHPKVVAAGQKQMARLNTNTRFLHDNIMDYTQRLLATMPDKLSVCMLVNSGSEANELAFRLARTFTGSKQLLVVDGAYHGNTNACIEASPYKFDGPGGTGAPEHVHKVMLPDPYRGPYQGMERAAGEKYAQDIGRVLERLKKSGSRPGAFICESLQGVAGQIIMPEGYLQAVYALVRDAGGVCIADEVQVGFGRAGAHMWAFETQGVVPDIVTLGKPIGNGHPMAAVITTQEIADAFVTGMEYFNTFGGNPVSCAIGLAVLDAIRDEKLRENALETGDYLQQRLRELQDEFALIGDVRGLGLFIGAEMVTDRESKRPATEAAAQLVEFVKTQRVILSTEGAHHNVLKIKPPIVFDRTDADRFIGALRLGLQTLS